MLARQEKAKPTTTIASRSHFYMLLMMMIECEKRYTSSAAIVVSTTATTTKMTLAMRFLVLTFSFQNLILNRGACVDLCTETHTQHYTTHTSVMHILIMRQKFATKIKTAAVCCFSFFRIVSTHLLLRFLSFVGRIVGWLVGLCSPG